jgi:hypothetical protein
VSACLPCCPERSQGVGAFEPVSARSAPQPPYVGLAGHFQPTLEAADRRAASFFVLRDDLPSQSLFSNRRRHSI